MTCFFNHIVGHQFNIQHLQSLAINNKVPHALLFVGKSGVGKRTVAEAFAKQLTNRSESNTVNNFFPDVHFVSKPADKKDLAVDLIRDLCSRIYLKPFAGDTSVAIIDDAHKMSISASNALLTTLEEPPKHAHLILVTSAPQKLPETIISRCQPIYFGDLDTAELEQVLSLAIKDSGCQDSLKKLSYYLDGSLSQLFLEEHINPTTRTIDESKLAKHFETLVAKYEKLNILTEALIQSGLSNNHSELVCAVTAITSEKDEMSIVWQAIYRMLRSKLQNSSIEEAGKVAAKLSLALNAEYLVHERNANAQLQMFSAFM